MATRTRRELEPGWVSWFCAKEYPRNIVKLRCPLGPIPEELVKLHGMAKAIKVHRPWRPEVDALVILPGAIRLIEAKIQKFMDGLAKLPVYKALVPTTPEMKAWRDLEIQMLLLIPTRIGWIMTAAEKMGVMVSTEAPDFIKMAWQERDKYWTKPHMKKREERKKKLQEMGF